MIHERDVPLDQIRDLHHVVRSLKWFRQFFREEAEALGKKYNHTFVVNDRNFSEAFLKWAEVFEVYRTEAPLNRAEFAVFSGGLMLRELLRATPVKTKAKGKIAECIPADPMAEICDFWPEGFLYATCCLRLVRTILSMDFNTNVALSPCFENLRIWESFRENVLQDVGLAVPFFDLFLGREPNWTGPEYFRSRPVLRDASLLPAAAG
jgi:hypothetical protein